MQSQNISEAETQFIDLPDDDVNLWDAVEIVGESATQFKIKWDGMNPATGKPWPDSWVQKHDATPDLVQGWRLNHPRKISTASIVEEPRPRLLARARVKVGVVPKLPPQGVQQNPILL
ncbi:hypothetical protein F5890DRAFT_192885 [Lentinula detonsa]|uniref:Chromo domain-containing protein n=1 Tax=Lentinula detonsa TaxID=2804962 RepID=A0AA38PY48_9AGAR|nr:hypothetical protein F5890DRAFT_192885 [Lentinula detonsa]